MAAITLRSRRLFSTSSLTLGLALVLCMSVTSVASASATTTGESRNMSSRVSQPKLPQNVQAYVSWLATHREFKERGYDYWVWTMDEILVIRWNNLQPADHELLMHQAQLLKVRINILDPKRPDVRRAAAVV